MMRKVTKGSHEQRTRRGSAIRWARVFPVLVVGGVFVTALASCTANSLLSEVERRVNLQNGIGPPGTLDYTFGTHGKTTTDFRSGDDQASEVAVLGNGEIVVGGTASNGSNMDFALARYHSDGTIDTSFGSGGKVLTDFGSSHDEAWRLAVQGDGKIVLAGYTNDGTNSDVAVARYNPNGSLDSSFGSGGKVKLAFGSPSYGSGAGIAIQQDGKIIISGWSLEAILVRLLTDGTLDPSFGSGGVVSVTNSSAEELGYGVALQSDGKIVVSESYIDTSSVSHPSYFYLRRYLTDGTADSSFSTVLVGFGTIGDNANGWDVKVQPDQKLVVAGYVQNTKSASGISSVFGLARFGANGGLDAPFNTITTNFGYAQDMGLVSAIQSDGKIVEAGSAFNGSNDDFGLVRYTSSGSLDTSFGTQGKVMTDFHSLDDKAYGIAIQSDGKLVVVGSSDNGGNTDFAIARYLP